MPQLSTCPQTVSQQLPIKLLHGGLSHSLDMKHKLYWSIFICALMQHQHLQSGEWCTEGHNRHKKHQSQHIVGLVYMKGVIVGKFNTHALRTPVCAGLALIAASRQASHLYVEFVSLCCSLKVMHGWSQVLQKANLQRLAQVQSNSVQDCSAWLCFLSGKGPHQMCEALGAILAKALCHMLNSNLHTKACKLNLVGLRQCVTSTKAVCTGKHDSCNPNLAPAMIKAACATRHHSCVLYKTQVSSVMALILVNIACLPSVQTW